MKITDIPTLQSPLHRLRVKLQHHLGNEIVSNDKIISEHNIIAVETTWELVDHYYSALVQRYPEFKVFPKYIDDNDIDGAMTSYVCGVMYSLSYFFEDIEGKNVLVPYHFNIYKNGRDITEEIDEIIEMGCVYGTAEYEMALAMI